MHDPLPGNGRVAIGRRELHTHSNMHFTHAHIQFTIVLLSCREAYQRLQNKKQERCRSQPSWNKASKILTF